VRVLDLFRPPLVALDIGTAVTRLSFASGEVLEQPSLEDVRPVMRGGVVADIAGVAGVVHALLGRRKRHWRQRPAAVVCAPSDASDAEREALIEAVAEGGASVVTVVPEPLAAAVGAGVDVASEYATAIVDIGDGVTDFAVIRNGTIVRSHARRIGCGTLRAAVRDWLELHQGRAAVAEETLEEVVRDYCAVNVPGMLDREQLETLLDPVIESMAAFLATSIRELPDAMAAEVIESGIHVTGGGAHLDRLVRRMEVEAGLPLTRASDPLHAVIRGARAMLRHRC
jgi:rod shape-determining protein MreB